MVKKTTHQRRVKETAKQVGQFILDTAIITVPLYLLFSATTILHQIAAHLSQFLLSFLGKTAIIASQNGAFHLIMPSLDAEISNLCSGGLELALLIGFIAASRDKTIEQRIKGIVVGLLFFILFNASRIAFTINSFGTPWFEPLHEALFRAVLIIGLVTYYAIWYYFE